MNCVNILIAAGADVNARQRDPLGQTALLIAAEEGHLDCVDALIAAGADVNAQVSSSRATALFRAVEKHRWDCAKALIAAGADVNLQDHVDRTALTIVVQSRNAAWVKLLIAAGADVNARTYIGRPELVRAVDASSEDIAGLLISAGADVNFRDTNGRTLLQEARPDMRAMLRKAGAKRTIDWSWVAPGLVAAASALAITTLLHWLVRPVPVWIVGLISVLAAACLVICVTSLLEGYYGLVDFIDGQNKRSRTLWTWAVLVVPAAVATHIYAPSTPIWAAGFVGILTAPILCSLTLLLPEQLPSPQEILRPLVRLHPKKHAENAERSPNPQVSPEALNVAAPRPQTSPVTQVSYRGFTFTIEDEYDVLCDDKKIVRGIWYRHPEDIKKETRNRMVLAWANVALGCTYLESDYVQTIVGGAGGVEELSNPGGAILWFASAKGLLDTK